MGLDLIRSGPYALLSKERTVRSPRFCAPTLILMLHSASAHALTGDPSTELNPPLEKSQTTGVWFFENFVLGFGTTFVAYLAQGENPEKTPAVAMALPAISVVTVLAAGDSEASPNRTKRVGTTILGGLLGIASAVGLILLLDGDPVTLSTYSY